MERTKIKAPGLKYRARRNAQPVPYWIASEAAVKAGYTPKSVRLHGDAAEIEGRCNRLQAEMLQWLGGTTSSPLPAFDGTFRTLLEIYEKDPESTFAELKPSSLVPYCSYLKRLQAHIGDREIEACDGRDVKRWFAIWRAPRIPSDVDAVLRKAGVDPAPMTPGERQRAAVAITGAKPRVAAARMALAVLKAALRWGIVCRMRGCAEFKAIIAEMEFESTRPRVEAPTAAQVEALRRSAHDHGAPERALLYALQFETTLRLWDIAGAWLPLSDPRPSLVLSRKRKWVGLMWSSIDRDLILSHTPAKTSDSSEARVMIDLKECPMVMAELRHLPETGRSGPIIANPRTSLPYTHPILRGHFRRDAKSAGWPAAIWNRDLRAAGITEAREADVANDDIAKVAGHTSAGTTGRVYDRANLAAARRIARARAGHRDDNG